MIRNNYYLHKDNKSGEITYLEFDKRQGYQITPKTRVEDAIEVSKIVMIKPSFSEKIIKKKIDIKVRMLLKTLEKIEENDGDDEDGIRKSLMDAERLKLNILNTYVKYLGHTYMSLTLKKIQIIINQLRVNLYRIQSRKRTALDMSDLFYLEEDEHRGRSR